MRVLNYWCQSVTILFLFLMNSSTGSALVSTSLITDESQQSFQPGQVWYYKTRAHEHDSTLTILKVDNFVDAVVIHVRLDQINLIDPGNKQGVRTNIPHMAFLRDALLESVTQLKIKHTRLADFSKDYKGWRDGNGSGTSWAWHFSVAEALNGLEAIYQQQSSFLAN